MQYPSWIMEIFRIEYKRWCRCILSSQITYFWRALAAKKTSVRTLRLIKVTVGIISWSSNRSVWCFKTRRPEGTSPISRKISNLQKPYAHTHSFNLNPRKEKRTLTLLKMSKTTRTVAKVTTFRSLLRRKKTRSLSLLGALSTPTYNALIACVTSIRKLQNDISQFAKIFKQSQRRCSRRWWTRILSRMWQKLPIIGCPKSKDSLHSLI
jgi:hypothetical protein